MNRVQRLISHAPIIVGSFVALAAIATMAPADAAPTKSLTVLQWNLCGNRSGCPSSDEPGRIVRAVVDQMRAFDADAALLQETCTDQAADIEYSLENDTGRDWTVRFAPILLKQSDDPATAPAKRCGSGGDYGIAMALPAESTWWRVTHLPSPDDGEWRVAMCATIPSQRIKLCNTHLTSPDEDDGDSTRSRQVAAFIDFALPSKHQVVIGGDLNLLPPDDIDHDGPGVTPLYDRLVECEQKNGRAARTGPGTYHRSDGVAEKVDYLFTDAGQSHECGEDTGPSAISDHRPLTMTVRWPRESPE